MRSPDEVVGEELQSIGLEELNARAALQTRVDSKYVVTDAVLGELVSAVAPRYQVLEIDGRADQQYDTVYFDTSGFGNYLAHLQRRRLSFKLRTRTYVSSGTSAFEVKMLDGRRNTVKVKIVHDGPPDVLGDAARDFYRHTLAERYGLDVSATMSPSLHNTYRRITLAAVEGEERVTVDHDLGFLRDGVRVAGLEPGLVLIETKSRNGAGVVDRALWRLGERPSRLSKYCIGIGSTQPVDLPNRYLRSMQRWFGLVLPEAPAAARPPAASPPVALTRPPRAPRPARPPRAKQGRRPLRDADADD